LGCSACKQLDTQPHCPGWDSAGAQPAAVSPETKSKVAGEKMVLLLGKTKVGRGKTVVYYKILTRVGKLFNIVLFFSRLGQWEEPLTS
jgi:hypothetical protein